ncbi:diguanylate cyclase [gamma proteobacterium NOR5-3]|nr:diguanylate cyclase [gamma proteobacterium NOR5-3]
MSEEEDWKQRYLQESRDWESADKLLRRVATRLAIAAEGYSPALDAVLQRIQKHIRSGDARDLEADLSELSRQIKSLDSGAVRPGQATAAPVTASATSPTKPATDHLPPRGGGDAREVLLTLIDEFSATQPGVGAFETLRETLQRGSDNDWHRVLERVIAEIRGLIQRISSDKYALQQLMQEVGLELGGISQSLSEQYSGLQEGRLQALALGEVMDAGVEKIRSHIESESDIDKLKAGVSLSLEGIRKGITGFIEKDAERFSLAESRNEELRARIVKMEAETEELTQKLNRNREKLMRDTLTGAHSRLAYDEMLAQEMSRYRRYQEPFCLVMLDIDFFKRVNDRFGHAAGDKALQLVASLVSDRIRETDYLFRVGGEEFVLLLPRTELAAAVPLVDAIRSDVGDSGFHYDDQPVQITLSAGVTAMRSDDTPETIFARADDAMYRAKKAGRDRLVTLD